MQKCIIMAMPTRYSTFLHKSPRKHQKILLSCNPDSSLKVGFKKSIWLMLVATSTFTL